MKRRNENHMDESATSAPLTSVEEPSSPAVGIADPPHRIEFEVHSRLTSLSGVNFSSLVIRRIKNGVCLEGVVEPGGNDMDVCDVARTVAGVDNVLNHLVVRGRRAIPQKG